MLKAKNCVGVLFLILSQPVFSASTTSGNMMVNASVVPACVFDSADAVNFGDYTGIKNDQRGNIKVNCTNGASYNISIGPGMFPGATVTTRKMAGSPSGDLAYSLYKDSARMENWGNAGKDTRVEGVGSGVIQSYIVYGQIAAGLTPPVGLYKDTVLITITY
jgi:spore coat protein U-like protein